MARLSTPGPAQPASAPARTSGVSTRRQLRAIDRGTGTVSGSLEGVISSSSAPSIPQLPACASGYLDLSQCAFSGAARAFWGVFQQTIVRSHPVTTHLSPDDTAADRRAMRQLATVIGCIAIAAVIMAVAVGLIMG